MSSAAPRNRRTTRLPKHLRMKINRRAYQLSLQPFKRYRNELMAAILRTLRPVSDEYS